MNIALIAHDKKKDDMIRFATAYKFILEKHNLYATGTTGTRIMEATGLTIERFQSGPLGGISKLARTLLKIKWISLFFSVIH